MEVQKRVLFLSAVALTFFSSRYASWLTIFPNNLIWNVTTLFLALTSVKVVWNVIVYPLYLSPFNRIPQPRDSSFFFGEFWRVIKEPTGNPHRDWIDNVDNNGLLYYRWIFNEPRVMPTTPKALAEVLVQRNYEFVKPQRVLVGLGRLIGKGLLLTEGEQHRRQRKALMPAFSFRHIKDLYPLFWAKSRELTRAMVAAVDPDVNPSSAVTMQDWSSRATLDILGVAGMGQDFNSIADPTSELYATYRNIFSPARSQLDQAIGFLVPTWILRWIPSKGNEIFMNSIATIKKVAANLVLDARLKLKKGDTSGLDILSVAIKSGDFSDEELVNHMMTFLAAGHETTASAISWAVYLLCKNPDMQKRLREEVQSSLPSINNSEETVCAQDIDKLPYLNAVVNETMRLFAPVALTLRESVDDTTIQGYFVPKGALIIICPWAINTSRKLWGDDAREFKPDRWMAPGHANSGGAESNYANMTFLHGPRGCIGKDFAKGEFMCIIAALGGSFEMELEDPEWELQIQGGLTAKPKGGLRVKLKPLENW